MKFTWGTGIFMSIILFVSLGIAFMIFAFNQEVNLVHNDYYEKGANYDNEMNVKQRSDKYIKKIKISQQEENIEIKFINNFNAEADSGEIFFYRPSDKAFDLKYKLTTDEIFITDKSKFIKGRYTIKISWFTDGKEYLVLKDYSIN